MTNSGISFANQLFETDTFNVFKYRNFYNGGGVATGDINNDGLTDIFFTANQGPNKLYLNKGNWQFEDISATAGFGDKVQWSTGVVMADVNADGWLDIYVSNAGHMMDSSLRQNQLFINSGNLTFADSAAAYGLNNSGYTTQASFFDYDLDGDLDCFLVNNSPIPVNTLNYANSRYTPAANAPVADFLKGGGDHLYRNDNGKFSDVTQQAGIYGSLIGFGLGVNVADINGDMYPDIYVSNDFFERDYLYINQRNGTFKDDIEERMQHLSLSSMGADIQDINNDGKPDIFTTDMLPADDYRLKTNTTFENYDVFELKRKQGFYNQFTQNALQVNDGAGNFFETAFYSGVAASDWSWGALMFDADSDGLNDIFVCNGIFRDVTDQDFIDFFASDVMQRMVLDGRKEEVNNIVNKMPSVPIGNMAFRNKGGLKFDDVGSDWGLGSPSFSNGAAYADFDNDGDLDLVVNNVNQEASLYRNTVTEQKQGAYISFTLSYKAPNAFAIGSKIILYAANQVLTRELIPSRGFQSSVEYKLTFGLGTLQPDSAHILWPDSTVTTIIKPAIGQLHAIDYNTTPGRSLVPVREEIQPVFSMLADTFRRHVEDSHVDFYYERNVPFMASRMGPACAVADVNGDGLEDLFIGGARQQPSVLFLQSKSGFQQADIPDFVTYKFADINAACFFDADGDGDADLFAGGGGNFSTEPRSFQNFLYLNDGKGNFALQRGALPINGANCAVALPIDVDADGDLDLFIGNHSLPQQYGSVAPAFLLKNNGQGKFADATNEVAPAFASLGMVTDAVLANVAGDAQPELLVVGEWMAPRMFTLKNKRFEEIDAGLNDARGWWQSCAAADLDNDGDLDLVLGNLGENFYLRPNSSSPVKLWVGDFDGNGRTDKVISQTIGSKDYPVFMKRDITDQMPSLKANNLKHHDFAAKTIQQLLGEKLGNTTPGIVNSGQSMVAWNKGDGSFEMEALPTLLQLSSIQSLLIDDVNKDGLPDIIAAGNRTDLLPQFCSLDASYGNLLINKGNRQWRSMMPAESGLYIKGMVKDIAILKRQSAKSYLFLQNNDRPILYAKTPANKNK